MCKHVHHVGLSETERKWKKKKTMGLTRFQPPSHQQVFQVPGTFQFLLLIILFGRGVKKFLGKSDYLAVFYIQTNVAWQAERNLYIVLLFQHMSGVKDVTGVCFVHGPGDTLLAARSNNRSETVLYMLAQLVLFFPYAEMMYSLCSCSTQQSQISSCIHVVVI